MRRLALAVVVLVGVLVSGCGSESTSGTGAASDASNSSRPTSSSPKVMTVPTVLVLDASGSMTTPDAPGPRIDAAKRAAQTLVDSLPDDAVIGLSTYGTGTGSSDAEKEAGCHDVTTLIPLGRLDRSSFAQQITSLTPSGYTPISLALQRAADQLPTDGSAQAIVLVSDGEDTCNAAPCDTASALKRAHPGLTISTVGFKTDGPASAQLACLAQTTGGLFVQAANADQLAARLIAVQNIDLAKRSLTSDGFDDIRLGQTLDDIRKVHSDFPDGSREGKAVVVFVDCDFGFIDGVLDSIEPHDGGRTIDGVTRGTLLTRVAELYGKPVTVDAGSATVVYRANSSDAESAAGYRIVVDGFAETGGSVMGTVKTIVLCRCAPKGGGNTGGGPEVVLKPVDGQGNTQAGFQKDESQRDNVIDCSDGRASPYDVGSGVRRCGTTADSGDACFPTARGAYVLCLLDPFDPVLTLRAASGTDVAVEPRSEDPYPIGLELDDGTHCRAVIGGSWGPRGAPDYSCKGADYPGIWSSPGDWHGIARGPDGWTVQVGPEAGPATSHHVKVAYLVAVA
jgi:von Willebrand factor type A domain